MLSKSVAAVAAIAAILSFVNVAKGQTCATATNCASCFAATGCEWCEFGLSWVDNSGNDGDVYPTSAGICQTAGQGCPDDIPDQFAVLSTGFDPTNDTTEYLTLVTTATGCTANRAIGVLPATNRCGSCVAPNIWCEMLTISSPQFVPSENGGSCMPAAECMTSKYGDVQQFNGARRFVSANPLTDCCALKWTCDDCASITGCSWCGLTVGDSTNTTQTGFGRCVAGATCGTPPTNISAIFSGVQIGGSNAVVAETVIAACNGETSLSSWATYTSAATCSGNNGDLWCRLSGTAGSANLNTGGMCMALHESSVCTSNWNFYVGGTKLAFAGVPVFTAGSSAYTAGPAAAFAAITLAAAVLTA